MPNRQEALAWLTAASGVFGEMAGDIRSHLETDFSAEWGTGRPVLEPLGDKRRWRALPQRPARLAM